MAKVNSQSKSVKKKKSFRKDEKKYSLRTRTGRKHIQVKFKDDPYLDRWYSTGTDNVMEAHFFALEVIKNDGILTLGEKKAPSIKLKDFAKDIFTARGHGSLHNRDLKFKRNFSDSYYEQHHSKLINYILPRFGEYRLTDLKKSEIEDWFVDLKAFDKNKELADSTKNKVLSAFRLVLGEAERQELIEGNVSREIKLIKADYEKREIFEDWEMAQLFPPSVQGRIKVWGSLMWATYFSVMANTGFRPAEVGGLTVDCIYWEENGVYTEQSVDNKTRQIKQSIKTTKKGQDWKSGSFEPTTMDLLNSLRLELERDELFTVGGKIVNADCGLARFEKVLVRQKLRHRTPYSLRHTFMTRMRNMGIPEEIMCLAMGHTSYRAEYDHSTPLDRIKTIKEYIYGNKETNVEKLKENKKPKKINIDLRELEYIDAMFE